MKFVAKKNATNFMGAVRAPVAEQPDLNLKGRFTVLDANSTAPAVLPMSLPESKTKAPRILVWAIAGLFCFNVVSCEHALIPDV
jgi:hypothetical protein